MSKWVLLGPIFSCDVGPCSDGSWLWRGPADCRRRNELRLVQVQAHVRTVSNVHGHFRSGHNRDHQSLILMHVKSSANTFVDMCTQGRHIRELDHTVTTYTSAIYRVS